MNAVAFETPWVLAGLVLLLLPLLRSNVRPQSYCWLELIPSDPWSQALSWLIRLLSMSALLLLILALAGIHRPQYSEERIGHGAHIVLLLDRSNSMDNSFAGKAPSGNEQSKADAAHRLLTEFIQHRPNDLMGIAEYSTSPLYVLPLTDNKAALQAAIDATRQPALAYTNISKGLAMGLDYFEQDTPSGSRILLLVSDGAAVIDPDSEAALRVLFKKLQIRLYWLFLRTDNTPGLHDVPQDPRDDNAQAMPERYLHAFFNSLSIPYQAYEADSPQALQQAIADINRLEQAPLHYQQTIPKQDLSGRCYALLSGLLIGLLLLKMLEVRL